MTSWTIWCADPWLISRCATISFTVTRWFSFTMASTAAMASSVTTWFAWPVQEASVTEVTPFMNFLLHSYTCCSDRRASPYWTFIRRWISVGFISSLLKKRMTECCSSLVRIANGAAIFTLLLHHNIAFLQCTATCQPLLKPWVSLLPTYRTIERSFEFLSHFLRFSFDSRIFTATLHIGGRSSIRILRTRHAMVTGTHLSLLIHPVV